MVFKAPRMDERVMGRGGEVEPGAPSHLGVKEVGGTSKKIQRE